MNNKNSKNKNFSPPIGVVLKGIFILILLLIFFSFAGKMMESGAEQRDEYYDLKDRCVSVEAIITNIEETKNVDDETEYDVYVSYRYNGRKYSNVFYQTYRKEVESGEKVDIEIDPEDPKQVLPKDSGNFSYIFGIVGLCVICYCGVMFVSNALAMGKTKKNWKFVYASPYLTSQMVQKDVNQEWYYTNQYTVWSVGIIAAFLVIRGIINYYYTSSPTASFAYGIVLLVLVFLTYRNYKAKKILLKKIELVYSKLLQIRVDSDIDGNDTTTWVLSWCEDWIPRKNQLVTMTNKTLTSFNVGDSLIVAVDGKRQVQRVFDAKEFRL